MKLQISISAAVLLAQTEKTTIINRLIIFQLAILKKKKSHFDFLIARLSITFDIDKGSNLKSENTSCQLKSRIVV